MVFFCAEGDHTPSVRAQQLPVSAEKVMTAQAAASAVQRASQAASVATVPRQLQRGSPPRTQAMPQPSTAFSPAK